MIAAKNLDWFVGLLAAESPSNAEGAALDYFESTASIWPQSITWQRQEVAPGCFNLLGNFDKHPRTVLCSHIDTVQPYLAPRVVDGVVWGRGSCDAKGQIFTMLLLAQRLQQEAPELLANIGFLIVVGEELDSGGAKAANALVKGVKDLVVLEPTSNCLITAAKGGLKVNVSIKGQTAHSGYPFKGVDAIQLWAQFNQQLLACAWDEDPLLGATTFNWGKLSSDNLDNVVPDLVTAQLNWRTTFTSAGKIRPWLETLRAKQPWLQLSFQPERLPFKFKTVSGFKVDTVAFGCDAPYLDQAENALMYGPGDIQVAHSLVEHLDLSEAEAASQDLARLIRQLIK